MGIGFWDKLKNFGKKAAHWIKDKAIPFIRDKVVPLAKTVVPLIATAFGGKEAGLKAGNIVNTIGGVVDGASTLLGGAGKSSGINWGNTDKIPLLLKPAIIDKKPG
jgi:hypothetical protein